MINSNKINLAVKVNAGCFTLIKAVSVLSIFLIVLLFSLVSRIVALLDYTYLFKSITEED